MTKLLFTLLLSMIVGAQAQDIKVSHGRYGDYYHLEFVITHQNSRLNSKYGFTNEGQFEVLINPRQFPVPSATCKKEIILRMPASLEKDAAAQIERKRALYHQIEEVVQGKKDAVKVVVELNPYVTVLKKKPLKLQLQYCNVFFRQSNNGAYTDKL